ncbi:MAG: sugar ABC transporter permease [Lachnospiraceae bacterium]|nr:sugar ABC transporter permease [Lachnospiraceae bacterium]
MNMRKFESIKGYLLLLPSLLAFCVFLFYPMLETIYLSFFDWNLIKPTKKFVGFSNYMELFTDATSLVILKNTLLYIAILLIFNLVMPYLLALFLEFIVKKGKSFYKAVFFLPSVISLVVGSILYTWIMNPVSGPLSFVLKKVGLTMPIWSTTQGWVIAVLCIITSWKCFGYNFIVILAGISGVPKEVVESAKVDDVSMHKIFLDLVIPMSAATGIYVLIYCIVQGLQFVYTPIKVITQGGPNYASSNLIYNSYHEAFTLFRTGTSSACSVITVIIFMILLILEFRFVERGIYYEN